MELKGIIVFLFLFLTNRALPHLSIVLRGRIRTGQWGGSAQLVDGHRSQKTERRLGGYAPSFIPLGWSLTEHQTQ